MTQDQIKAHVLAYFKGAGWPNADENTNLADDLGLLPYQILELGTELADQLGCNPTRTQIGKCKTIKDLIALLFKTQGNVDGHAKPNP